ncbi:MAG: alpha/beta hydrolase [Pyrinomonadaceae bacterium]|nr:alpha/beta hydrolase [Pyrinomonadaceae bacterium]
MRRSLNILSLVLTVSSLLAAMWIIVPAPDYRIWLFSVAASEWSLWLGAAALLGGIFGLGSRYFYGKGPSPIISLIVGSIALVISLYPFFSVVSIAREQNTSLSLKRYFSELWNGKTAGANDYQTYAYAVADGRDLQLDVCLPTAISPNNGASVIVVHGGSWNGGRRSDFPQWNRWLAAQGFTVFDVDYRLTQPNYLTATGDVKCAVRWIKEHATEFNIAPERIAVLGRSAGAHLALLAAYSADDARFPASCQNNKQSVKVRAVVSFYAPVDLLWAYDNPANERVIDGPATLSSFLGGSPHESAEMRERYLTASPLSHVSPRTPPTLMIHGGQDQLVRVENMRFLDAKLNEVGAAHQTIFVPYAQHGFDYNFNGFGAQIVQPEILRFLSENTRAE